MRIKRPLGLIALLLATSAATPTMASFHVLVDPGHGGVDKGATRGSLKESEIALKVSLLLAEHLKKDPRFKASLTRIEDEKLTLEQRAEIADRLKPDLFVSIHLNSSTDPRAQGKEFYFQNQLPADEEALFLASHENEEAKVLDPVSTPQKGRLSAQTDLKHILEDLHRNHRIQASSELSLLLHESWAHAQPHRRTGSRAIRQAPFFVVSNVSMPSVLVELGFISHAQEGPLLAQDDYQKELAKSLYEGIVKFKETVDKDRQGKLQSGDAL